MWHCGCCLLSEFLSYFHFQNHLIEQVKGDLFRCPPENCLAHCVSQDMGMGKGIAKIFKLKFDGVGELLSQGKVTDETYKV